MALVKCKETSSIMQLKYDIQPAKLKKVLISQSCTLPNSTTILMTTISTQKIFYILSQIAEKSRINWITYNMVKNVKHWKMLN